MDFAYERQKPPSRRLVGIAAVVLLHLLIVYALMTGLARKAVEVIKRPLEVKVLEEIKPPPPPPPPPPPKEIKPPPEAPKVEAPPPPFIPPPEVTPPAVAAPAIESVTTPPAAPPPIAPPTPPAPPAPPAAKAGDIALYCPKQVKPEMPRKALQEGVSGVVKAEARIKGGKVIEVRILSGPRVFYPAVRAAMMEYQCQSGNDEVLAVQEFTFQVD